MGSNKMGSRFQVPLCILSDVSRRVATSIQLILDKFLVGPWVLLDENCLGVALSEAVLTSRFVSRVRDNG